MTKRERKAYEARRAKLCDEIQKTFHRLDSYERQTRYYTWGNVIKAHKATKKIRINYTRK